MIKTDYVKIKQILLNLMSNAAKFTHNGEVKLQMMAVEQGKKPYIEIKVIDTGIGMDEQGLDRLFEPFTQADTSTTRKYGGTGLGLTITKGFVEMLHGELQVESKLGEGTVFTVLLPCDSSLLSDNERHKSADNKYSMGMARRRD
jgi:signal transduction histidine kinase